MDFLCFGTFDEIPGLESAQLPQISTKSVHVTSLLLKQ